MYYFLYKHLSSIYLKRAPERRTIYSLISLPLGLSCVPQERECQHLKKVPVVVQVCLFFFPFPVIETQSRPTHLSLTWVAASSVEPNIYTLANRRLLSQEPPHTAALATPGYIPIFLLPTELQKELSTCSFTAAWKKPSLKVYLL